MYSFFKWVIYVYILQYQYKNIPSFSFSSLVWYNISMLLLQVSSFHKKKKKRWTQKNTPPFQQGSTFHSRRRKKGFFLYGTGASFDYDDDGMCNYMRASVNSDLILWLDKNIYEQCIYIHVARHLVTVCFWFGWVSSLPFRHCCSCRVVVVNGIYKMCCVVWCVRLVFPLELFFSWLGFDLGV